MNGNYIPPKKNVYLNLNRNEESIMDWSEYNPEWYKKNDPPLYKQWFTNAKQATHYSKQQNAPRKNEKN